jgi:hypothetical protein
MPAGTSVSPSLTMKAIVIMKTSGSTRRRTAALAGNDVRRPAHGGEERRRVGGVLRSGLPAEQRQPATIAIRRAMVSSRSSRFGMALASARSSAPSARPGSRAPCPACERPAADQRRELGASHPAPARGEQSHGRGVDPSGRVDDDTARARRNPSRCAAQGRLATAPARQLVLEEDSGRGL